MSKLLPYEAYYENSRGERLNLSEPPYVMNESRLFDMKWSLSAVQRPLGEGVRLLRAKRQCEERTMTVHVLADTAQSLGQRLGEMSAIFDYDVHSLTAGKLWINGQYLSCWCSARTKTLSCDFVSNAVVTVSIYPENPVWCSERSCEIECVGEADAGGHKYSYRYPFRYGTGESGLTITNAHYAPCPMRIIFSGSAKEPAIYFNGERIGINITLDEGEKAVIDQQTREVYKVSAEGVKTNCFNDRTRNGRIFEYAPVGVSTAVPDSASEVEIILIEQRSEPLWALS